MAWAWYVVAEWSTCAEGSVLVCSITARASQRSRASWISRATAGAALLANNPPAREAIAHQPAYHPVNQSLNHSRPCAHLPVFCNAGTQRSGLCYNIIGSNPMDAERSGPFRPSGTFLERFYIAVDVFVTKMCFLGNKATRKVVLWMGTKMHEGAQSEIPLAFPYVS